MQSSSREGVLSDISPLLNVGTVPVRVLDILERYYSYREFACLEVLGYLCGDQLTALRCTGDRHWTKSSPCFLLRKHNHFLGTLHLLSIVGAARPKYEIPQEQLEYLLNNNFSVPQISLRELSGEEWRCIISPYEVCSYSNILDEDPDATVRRIQDEFGLCGDRQMQGHLLAKGIRVQQVCVR